MANVAITSLPFVTTVVPGTDVLPLVSGGLTTKATPNDIVNAVLQSPGGIGTVAAAAGSFTQLSASSTVSGAGFNAYMASPPSIGGTAPNTIAATTIGGTTITASTGFVGGTFSGTTIGGTTITASSGFVGGTVSGTTITASTQFSGPGTGLTGTAASLTAGAVTNGVYTSGSYSDPSWIASLAGSKISGDISGNAATATNASACNGYTFNQAVQTGSSPAFAGLTINDGTLSLVDTTYSVTSTIANSYGTVTINSGGGAQQINLIASTNGVHVTGSLIASGNLNVTGNGYISGIYTNTTASAANVRVESSGLLYRSTSSRKYKNTINDAVHGLADVLNLRAVTFKSNTGGDTIFGGFIAEEIDEAGLHEFVEYNELGEPDAVSYANMVSLLTKAIQELNAKVESLEAKLK